VRECTYYDMHRRERCTECSAPLDLCKCERLNEQAHNRLMSQDGKMIRVVRAELDAAREESPGTRHMTVALMEKVGELAQVLLKHNLGQNITAAEVFQEAVQVAAMAIRIGTEGDESFTYEPFSVLGEKSVIL